MQEKIKTILSKYLKGKKLDEATKEILSVLAETRSQSGLPRTITRDGVEYTLCWLHQVYEPSHIMVKGKTYCKPAYKIWSKLNSRARTLKESIKVLRDAGAEIPQALVDELNEIERAKKDPKTYGSPHENYIDPQDL